MTPGSHSFIDLSHIYDVLVIGGGNAALCAAMTAREAGARVLLLVRAPEPFGEATAATRATFVTGTTGTPI